MRQKVSWTKLIVSDVGLEETRVSNGFYQDEHDVTRYKIKVKINKEWYIGSEAFELDVAIKMRDDYLDGIKGRR